MTEAERAAFRRQLRWWIALYVVLLVGMVTVAAIVVWGSP